MSNHYETYANSSSIDEILVTLKVGYDIVNDRKTTLGMKRDALKFVRGISEAMVSKVEHNLRMAEEHAAEWAGIRNGIKPSTDDIMDGGEAWWCFPADYDDDAIVAKLYSNGYSPGGHYQGPGQAYTDPIYIKRSETRVLVTQRFGYDI